MGNDFEGALRGIDLALRIGKRSDGHVECFFTETQLNTISSALQQAQKIESGELIVFPADFPITINLGDIHKAIAAPNPEETSAK